MHEPFHLYEFALNSFHEHSKTNNYVVAYHQYHVAQTYMSKIFDLILVPYTKWSNTGMQLSVWLKKR